MDFNRIAQEFPGTSMKAYLDAACVSITPRSAVTAIQQFLEMALVCSAESSTQLHLNMDAMRRQALSEAAVFLHTGEENLALVEKYNPRLEPGRTRIAPGTGFPGSGR